MIDKSKSKYTCADHHPEADSFGEYDQLARFVWSTEMNKTHTQHLCGECGRFKVWLPRLEKVNA